MKFIRHIIVPSLNYGAFIDDNSQKEKYVKIDEKLYEMARKLLVDGF